MCVREREKTYTFQISPIVNDFISIHKLISVHRLLFISFNFCLFFGAFYHMCAEKNSFYFCNFDFPVTRTLF